MAGSIESNAAIYKKHVYKYIAPTPPTELLDSSVYVVDFTNRKFVHVGLDSQDNFNVVIHIITASRYINIRPQFLKRIYSLIGNILSFILDPPQECPENIFLEDETATISKSFYRGQNYLVLNSRTQEGCRVLLNREDLIVLQNLESVIFDSVGRISTYTRTNVLYQYKQVVKILAGRDGLDTNVNVKDMRTYISRIPEQEIDIFLPESLPSYIGQFMLYSLEQLAMQTLSKRETTLKFMLYKAENVAYSSLQSTPENKNELTEGQPMSYDVCGQEEEEFLVQADNIPSLNELSSFYSPPSYPVQSENDGPSFYNLIHVSSPPLASPTDSPPKWAEKAKYVYPGQSKRVKRKILFENMLFDE